jgi:hypothetical protein
MFLCLSTTSWWYTGRVIFIYLQNHICMLNCFLHLISYFRLFQNKEPDIIELYIHSRTFLSIRAHRRTVPTIPVKGLIWKSGCALVFDILPHNHNFKKLKSADFVTSYIQFGARTCHFSYHCYGWLTGLEELTVVCWD